jgi:uncharacterized protein
MQAKILKTLRNWEQVYPHALEKQFPDIFKRIVEAWETPQIKEVFSALLSDNSETRRSLPRNVISDITYLQELHAELSRKKRDDAWGFEVGKKRDVHI